MVTKVATRTSAAEHWSARERLRRRSELRLVLLLVIFCASFQLLRQPALCLNVCNNSSTTTTCSLIALVWIEATQRRIGLISLLELAASARREGSARAHACVRLPSLQSGSPLWQQSHTARRRVREGLEPKLLRNILGYMWMLTIHAQIGNVMSATNAQHIFSQTYVSGTVGWQLLSSAQLAAHLAALIMRACDGFLY